MPTLIAQPDGELPFPLYCVSCGAEYLQHGLDRIRCAACGTFAEVATFPGHGCTIVDFHPRQTLEAGAYEDEAAECPIDYASMRPTSAPWPPNYKMAPLSRLTETAGQVVVDLGCRNGEMLRHFAPHNTTIGVDISWREMVDHEPNALDSDVPYFLVRRWALGVGVLARVESSGASDPPGTLVHRKATEPQ